MSVDTVSNLYVPILISFTERVYKRQYSVLPPQDIQFVYSAIQSKLRNRN